MVIFHCHVSYRACKKSIKLDMNASVGAVGHRFHWHIAVFSPEACIQIESHSTISMPPKKMVETKIDTYLTTFANELIWTL